MIFALSTAARQIWRNPKLSLVILFVLGASSLLAVLLFAVIDAFLWQDAGFPAAERVISIHSQRSDEAPKREVPPASYLFIRDHAISFETCGASQHSLTTIENGELVESLETLLVTSSYFEVLGIRPELGRSFLREEEEIGRDQVVILSRAAWSQYFGSAPDVVGRQIRLDGRQSTIIGIMPTLPAEFSQVMLWRPLALNARDQADYTYPLLRMRARLREQTSLADARGDLARLSAALGQAHPEQVHQWAARAVSWREEWCAPVRPILWLLVGVGGLTAALAGINATGLLLARFAARQKGFAIQFALGAPRRALLFPLLCEGVILSALGVGAGLLAAIPCMTVMGRFARDLLSQAFLPEINARTLLLGFGLALFYAGLLVVETSRRVLSLSWRNSLNVSALADRRVRAVQKFLVVAQLAVSFALAANAGRLVQQWHALRATEVGFSLRGLACATLRTPMESYGSPQKLAQLANAIESKLRQLPGVASAAITTNVPLSSDYHSVPYMTPQEVAVPFSEHPKAAYATVSPGYFDAMAIRLIAGRTFTPGDRAGVQRVVIINETVARRTFPGREAVGQWLFVATRAREWRFVVGVVADVKNDDLYMASAPQVYEPFSQAPLTTFVIVVRAANNAELPSARLIQSAVAAVDPTLAIGKLRVFEFTLDRLTARERFVAFALLAAALFAIALAVAGFGSLMALTTLQREREFGLRLAIGETPAGIVRLVLDRALRLSLLGSVLGAFGAYALGKIGEATVPLSEAAGWANYGLAAGLLAISAVLASAIPAWKSAQLAPADCLRAE